MSSRLTDQELVIKLRMQLQEIVRTLDELDEREMHVSIIISKDDAEKWHQRATVSKTVYL